MTDEQLDIVRGAMQHPLLASEGDIQVEVISQDLSPEQASLVIGIKMEVPGSTWWALRGL